MVRDKTPRGPTATEMHQRAVQDLAVTALIDAGSELAGDDVAARAKAFLNLPTQRPRMEAPDAAR